MTNTHIHQLYKELQLQFKELESVDESRVKARKMSSTISTLVIFIQFIGLASFIVFPILLSSWGLNEGVSFLLGMLILLGVTAGPLFLEELQRVLVKV